MAPFPEFFQLVFMTFAALLWEYHGLLFGSSLMVDVAGDTVNPLPGMLRFHPGLEKPRGPFLVAGDTESYIDLFHFLRGSGAHGE
jgi:hypothetical protein